MSAHDPCVCLCLFQNWHCTLSKWKWKYLLWTRKDAGAGATRKKVCNLKSSTWACSWMQNSTSTTLQFFLTFHIFVTKPREHCIIIFLDILDFVEKLKVEMARRKIDSYSPHNKIFIPWEKTRPKDIRRKWMPINGRDDRGSVYIRKKVLPHPLL